MTTMGGYSADRGRQTLVMLICGTVITLATLAAWLYGATHGVDTSPLFAFVVPVVGALFIANNLGKTSEAATQAAAQTNGQLDGRVKAAVAAALADRDAARTRQVQGDIVYGGGSDQANHAPVPHHSDPDDPDAEAEALYGVGSQTFARGR